MRCAWEDPVTLRQVTTTSTSAHGHDLWHHGDGLLTERTALAHHKIVCLKELHRALLVRCEASSVALPSVDLIAIQTLCCKASMARYLRTARLAQARRTQCKALTASLASFQGHSGVCC